MNIENKPLVSILMAVYKPNEVWLIEQLKSLNEQDYTHIELIVWDDCPDEPVLESYFETYITKFQYTLIRGIWNLGSNGAFEELTKRATGEYICYCDQDDIWNSNKVSVMLERLLETGATLVCCDQYIIDENSQRTGETIVDIRKRHVWHSGENCAKYLIADNFVTGCASIIPTAIAQKAVPFLPLLVHDQWLGIVASLHGRVEVIMEPLIGYRQHSGNQTGILVGVEDKETYYEWRIDYFLRRTQSVRERLKDVEEVQEVIEEYETWLSTRARFFRKHTLKDFKKLVAGREFGRHSVALETAMPFIPNFLFKKIIGLAKRGIL